MFEKYEPTIKLVLFAVALLAVFLYLKNWHEDGVRNAVANYAEKQEQVTRKAIADAQETADKKYASDREKELQQFAAAKNPDQMGAVLQALLGLSRPPAVIQLPAAPVTPSSLPNKIPDGPSAQGVSLPVGDYQKLYKSATDGYVCTSTDLPKCAADLGRRDGEVSSLKRQLDTSEASRKGGTRKEKTWKAIKIIGCSGGGAYIGSLISPKGAAIGGAGAAGFCEIVF